MPRRPTAAPRRAPSRRPRRAAAARVVLAFALSCAALLLARTAPLPSVDAFAPAAAIAKGRERGARPWCRASAATALAVAEAPVAVARKKHSAKKKRSAKKKQSQRAPEHKVVKRQKTSAKGKPRGAPKAKRPATKGAVAKRRKAPPKSRGKAPRKKQGAASPRKPLTDLQLGSTISGTVVGVSKFGAFLRTAYATSGGALLHISQISDEKISDVQDHFKVGDHVDHLRVITVDAKKGDVGLSLRPPRPKRRGVESLEVGDEIEGKVVQVVSYGVFVDVGVNVNALLHVSRITGGRIDNIRLYLNEGDPVSVHVISTDVKKKTVAVSRLEKNADRYLDKRMRRRRQNEEAVTEAEKAELQYFDQVIKELEQVVEDK